MNKEYYLCKSVNSRARERFDFAGDLANAKEKIADMIKNQIAKLNFGDKEGLKWLQDLLAETENATAEDLEGFGITIPDIDNDSNLIIAGDAVTYTIEEMLQ